MRGRLLFVLVAEFARLDAVAMSPDAPDMDPDFHEPRIVAAGSAEIGVRLRRELPPVRVHCQLEHESFEALNMVGAGNQPLSRVLVTVHFSELEKLALVDKTTGRALLGPGDRLTGFYDREGNLVETADLYVTETRPLGPGFGLARPRRNLLLLVLEPRAASSRTTT